MTVICFAFHRDTEPAIASFVNRRISAFFPSAIVSATPPEGAVLVELPPHSPLIDEGLIAEMIAAAIATGQRLVPVDAIPGSHPIAVAPVPSTATESREFFSRMQNLYCTNMDVRRPNRRQIFETLCRAIPDLATWPLQKVLNYLETDAGVDLIISYGEPVELEKFSTCPSCDSPFPPQPLHSGTSHPITGFLTKNVSVYSHCVNCGLTFLNRQMPKADLWRYYREHSYKNPQTAQEVKALFDDLSAGNVSHYENYRAVIQYIDNLPQRGRVGDLGAGRGEFALMAKGVRPDIESVAFEWRFPEVVKAELQHRGVVVRAGDFQESLKGAGTFSLLTAWEVLEHLKVADLRPLLFTISKALTRGGYFIFSTPDFNSKYARALDFWAMAPGEHISVLSRRFLEPLLKDADLEIVEELHECVTMKRPDDWFAFGANTDVCFSSKSSSGIINDILSDEDLRKTVRENLRRTNQGSELILCCRRV